MICVTEEPKGPFTDQGLFVFVVVETHVFATKSLKDLNLPAMGLVDTELLFCKLSFCSCFCAFSSLLYSKQPLSVSGQRGES